MGAKSKLTPEVQATLCECVGLGMTYEQSADVVGIGVSTFREWMATKPAFLAVIKRAELDGMRRRLHRIERAGLDGNWQADMTWLERRYPEQWGRRERQQVEHSGSVRTELAYVNDWRAPAVETVETTTERGHAQVNEARGEQSGE